MLVVKFLVSADKDCSCKLVPLDSAKMPSKEDDQM